VATFREQVKVILKQADEQGLEYEFEPADILRELQTLVELYTPTITTVRIVAVPDDNPDLSYLGYYAHDVSEVDTDKYTIIDRGDGDAWRGGERYFVSSFNYEGETPEDREKYARQDYNRMKSYRGGHWWTVCVFVEADVLLPGEGTRKVKSPGIWGIESDSGEPYVYEVGQDEVGELRHELEKLGVEDFSAFDNLSETEIVERFS
jgi:hypothetical protein